VESEVSVYHDAPAAFDEAELAEMQALVAESEAAEAAAEAVADAAGALFRLAVVDWADERQQLQPRGDGRTVEQRLRAITALRQAVLAPEDTGVLLAGRQARAGVTQLTPSRAAACAGVEDRSDATLERFLRARKYDVAVAAAMFLEHRRWRAGFGWVQGAGDIAVQLAQEKVCMQGLCRDGLPFVIVVARNHRPTGKEGVAELNRFFVYVMDTIATAMGPAGAFRILVDLRGLSSKHADLAAMRVAFDVLQKGFPERMAHLWLAEPPAVFHALWKLITPFVAPATREKARRQARLLRRRVSRPARADQLCCGETCRFRGG